MNSTKIATMALLAVLTATVIAAAVSPATSGEDIASLGSFNSYTVNFVWNGENVQTVTWDFGDASATVTADVNDSATSANFNPSHTYSKTGTYTVTVTAVNTVGTAVKQYTVTILGFPLIAFNSNGGTAVDSIQMDSRTASATKPADPTKDGAVFDGWYTDKELTTAYDWDSVVSSSMTLYAKWTDNNSTSGKTADWQTWVGEHSVLCILIVLAAIALIAAVFTRNIYIAVIAAGLVVVSLVFTGIWGE